MKERGEETEFPTKPKNQLISLQENWMSYCMGIMLHTLAINAKVSHHVYQS